MAKVLYLSLIILISFSKVKSTATICESACACRHNNGIGHDYIGMEVDCSYRIADINKTIDDLPTVVNSLDLSSNNLNSIQPSQLLTSKTMKVLFLNNNAIGQIAPNALQLPELRTLDLSNNKLEYVDGDTFKSIKKLEYLNLANNKFTTFSKLTFHHLSDLNTIRLDNNNIGPSLRDVDIFDRDGFGLTHKIKILSICGINLNTVPENFLIRAYDLRELTICNNNLTYIFELPYTLESLDLSGNPIKQIDSEDFSNVPALRVLKLNRLSIIEVPDDVFRNLRNLKSLELESNNNMTRFSSLAFGQEVLEDSDDFLLEKLSLKGSRVTSLNKVLMEPFERLISLDLQGNPWECDCNLLWLKDLRLQPHYYDHLRCATPKKLYNRRIFELDLRYFKCTSKKHKSVVIAIITICMVLSAFAIWLYRFMNKAQTRPYLIQELSQSCTAYTILPTNPPMRDTAL